MKTLFWKMAVLATAMLLAVAPGLAKDKAPKPKVVNVQDGQGKSLGTATLSAAANGVKIALNLHDLPAGEHGIHVHQTAKCEGPDFKSPPRPFNPHTHHHRFPNPESPHPRTL